MKTKLHSSRGQVLILIAFAIMGLVAMTGLAVDTGLTFSDRRHAQNAADTAAIAGAMTMIDQQQKGNTNHGDLSLNPGYYAHVVNAARDMAADNGYDGLPQSPNTVEVYTCDMPEASCGYYQGNPDYVQVIINSYIDTFFARVIGISQTHNSVQAVALGDHGYSGSLYNGENIISLATQCQNPVNFSVQGGATVNLYNTDPSSDGGLYVNTNDPSCGFTCSSNADYINGDITTAGGTIDTSAHCSENITGDQSTTGSQWDFPVTLEDMGLEVPSECSGPIGTYQNWPSDYTVEGYPTVTGPVTVLTPGYYSDFPPQKEITEGKLLDKIYMKPGVYCVADVIKLTEQNLTLIGYDVTIFIRGGYDFNINGAVVQIDAADSGPYAGYLMIVEPNYDLAPQDCTINGNTSNYFEGAIFAPYCNVKINGGSEPTGFESQVIGYTVQLVGTADISFTYDADKNPTVTQPAETGLVR